MRVPRFADFEHYIQWQVQPKVYMSIAVEQDASVVIGK